MREDISELITAVERLGAHVLVSHPDRYYRVHVDSPCGELHAWGPRWLVRELLRAVLLGSALTLNRARTE
jgi:hypothetical protein